MACHPLLGVGLGDAHCPSLPVPTAAEAKHAPPKPVDGDEPAGAREAGSSDNLRVPGAAPGPCPRRGEMPRRLVPTGGDLG